MTRDSSDPLASSQKAHLRAQTLTLIPLRPDKTWSNVRQRELPIRMCILRGTSMHYVAVDVSRRATPCADFDMRIVKLDVDLTRLYFSIVFSDIRLKL